MPSNGFDHTFELTDRLRALARQAARRGSTPPPPLRVENQTRAYFGLYRDLPLPERQARSLAYALANEPVLIFPGERVNGIFYDGPQLDPQWYHPTWGDACAVTAAEHRIEREIPEVRALWDEWPEIDPRDGQGSFLISKGAAPGHIGWNYDLVLSLGVEGLIARHRERLSRTADPEARDYYQGVLICLEAMLAWNRKHFEALEHMRGAATTPEERAFIAENMRVMARVPAQRARTFREAIQSFYFQWLSVMFEVPYGGNSPGRFDYFLWPYLKPEYESGALSYQQAAELVAELFIKMDERVHLGDGHVNTIVVGGIRPDGTDGVNPLTHIILDVFQALDLTHPAVYTRISAVNPPDYVERCIDYTLAGGNRCQILADEPIMRAMTRDSHMLAEDAAMYMCGGCMELSPHGMNSDLLFSFVLNVPKLLELLVTGGKCLVTGQQRLAASRSLRDFATFEDFYAAFDDELERVLRTKFRCLEIYAEELARCRPTFLQSSMIADCLERGRSQHVGGARYADCGSAPVGIQNTADALVAIKMAVFDQAFCTAGELIAALEADFAGYEPLHAHLRALPKYGLGEPEADGMMGRVLASVCHVYEGYTTRHGGRMKPMVFTFVWAPQMGASLGASADGRRAGRPIAHGLSPQTCGMANGITASINACTSLPADLVSGGATTMWDMDPGWINHNLLASLVRVFIQQGGQIFQGNMTSVEDLRRAVEDPDAYRHLIVRVGGYSARFVTLDRALQQEIIERHRHSA